MQENINDFFERISDLLEGELPFVVYRKPNENELNLYIQNTSKIHFLSSFKESGFVLAPFEKTGDKILIPKEASSLEKIEFSENQFNSEYTSELAHEVVENLQFKKKHVALVKKGIHCIHSTEIDKIVLSRSEAVTSSDLNPVGCLKRMIGKYSNAFVYLWFHPRVGMWMGASPERLIQTNGNKLKTMALAGTQPYLGKLNVSWTEKDQHEQEFVTEYILEQLKDLTKSLHVSGAETVIAGNLLHLRTTITAEMNSNDFLEELIEKIHPTPAVCGVPKNKAASYILENEGYDRSYYSGYLGELNMNNSNTLFVNLRCMEIVGQTATLFVGGGITKDSIPENEWRETVDKAFIMKSILNE